ncbi:hypothetical protein pdam_00023335 [Pocillopora damicornis]|uniref:Uncharacterized protein n=1 Tax=Pocillopora damicornis TaxID=46731 RepID=A0A3M6UTI7_POCDA|nr:hypothetical protein pdam_00023335 [Pocillopora damicornis]
MEELSAWIFSTEQEDYVEQRIRLMLMEDSRINSQSDWKSFAEHVLDVSQKQQVQLLVVWQDHTGAYDFGRAIEEVKGKLQSRVGSLCYERPS